MQIFSVFLSCVLWKSIIFGNQNNFVVYVVTCIHIPIQFKRNYSYDNVFPMISVGPHNLTIALLKFIWNKFLIHEKYNNNFWNI